MNSIRHTQEQLLVASSIRYVNCDAKISLRHQATSPLGNIFWRPSRFSPKQPESQSHGDYNVSVLNQQHDFCNTMANIFPLAKCGYQTLIYISSIKFQYKFFLTFSFEKIIPWYTTFLKITQTFHRTINFNFTIAIVLFTCIIIIIIYSLEFLLLLFTHKSFSQDWGE